MPSAQCPPCGEGVPLTTRIEDSMETKASNVLCAAHQKEWRLPHRASGACVNDYINVVPLVPLGHTNNDCTLDGSPLRLVTSKPHGFYPNDGISPAVIRETSSSNAGHGLLDIHSHSSPTDQASESALPLGPSNGSQNGADRACPKQSSDEDGSEDDGYDDGDSQTVASACHADGISHSVATTHDAARSDSAEAACHAACASAGNHDDDDVVCTWDSTVGAHAHGDDSAPASPVDASPPALAVSAHGDESDASLPGGGAAATCRNTSRDDVVVVVETSEDTQQARRDDAKSQSPIFQTQQHVGLEGVEPMCVDGAHVHGVAQTEQHGAGDASASSLLDFAWETDIHTMHNHVHTHPHECRSSGVRDASAMCNPFSVPDTWAECTLCAAGPWEVGEHNGVAYADDDGVVRCHVVPVDPSTGEYASVVLPLVQHGVKIVSVERVQNYRLWSRFRGTELSEAMLPWETTSRDLWHGTSAKDLAQLLLEGLDQRVASRGHFGRGLYFSDHPAKAHRYTSKRPASTPGGESGIRTMLRCKVLLGKTKRYARGVNDPSLLREPSGYNSVEGNISGHNELVVYENSRVQIDYVVKYTVTPSTVTPPSPTTSAAVADIARELQKIGSADASVCSVLSPRIGGGAFGGASVPHMPFFDSTVRSKRSLSGTTITSSWTTTAAAATATADDDDHDNDDDKNGASDNGYGCFAKRARTDGYVSTVF